MTGADVVISRTRKQRDLAAKYWDLAQATLDIGVRAQYLELAARYLELAEAAERTGRIEDRTASRASGRSQTSAS
jgi:hypothetical protein